MKIALTVFIVLSAFVNWAQTPSELAKLKVLYPEYDFAIIKDETNVTITHDKVKGIKVIETIKRKIYLMSDRAGLFKDDNIYSSFFEELISKEAYALNKMADKDKYEKVKVSVFNKNETISEEVFFDDGASISFSYDGLKNESIMNLEYTKEITNAHLSFTGSFGASYPFLNKSLTISVEDGIELGTVYFNMDSTDIDYTKTHLKGKTLYEWKKDTLEIFKSEISSPDAKYYVPHFITRILYYIDNNGAKVSVLENVKDLYNWYISLTNQMTCNNKLDLQAVIDEIISPEDTELEKVKKVYNWVQKNIKYIAIEDGLGGLIPRDPSLVTSRRYGDCKDMATLIVQLLKLQDIKACQAWIGTTDIPYKYEEMPSPVIDNHMIAAYFNKETKQYIFLDATDDQLTFGFPSDFIQGKEALINLGDSFEIVTVPIISANKTLMADSAVVSIDNDKLVGKGELLFTGYYAADFKHSLSRVSNEKGKKSHVEGVTMLGSNKYQLDSYAISTGENSLTYDYSFTLPSYINKTENEIYVNLNLLQLPEFFLPYEVKDRKTAVIENYTSKSTCSFTLEIPKGYKVDFVPKNFFVDGGTDFYVKINYSQEKEGQITYSFDFFLDYLMLDVARVPEMKELGKKLKNAYKETIILKKIEGDE